MDKKSLYSKMLVSAPWLPVFDDQAPDTATKEVAAKDAADKAKAPKQFAQDEVNRLLADDRRKHQTANQKLMEELEALKQRTSLTEEEKAGLETRLEQLQNQFLTKEEVLKRESEKLKKASEDRIKGLETDAKSWKDRFTDSTIVRSITDAAISGEAYAPEQIVAILRHSTRLVEAVGEDGKPTGNLIPTVKFDDVDSKGEPVTLELPVAVAVKRMSEIDRYFNLFKGKGSGGVGGTGSRINGQADLVSLAKDPAAYRKARKEGKI